MTPDGTATLLDCLWHWARTRPDAIYCTQPVAPGIVVDYRWDVVADQVRRMAAHLRTLDLPPASRIALLGTNTAHWIMADLAIWAAGHVSVPVHPGASAETLRATLEQSATRLLFVGRLDGAWTQFADGIPDTLPRIGLPLAPPLATRTWEAIVAVTPPGDPVPRTRDEVATLGYGAHAGAPLESHTSFGAMLEATQALGRILPIRNDDRMLSYLPFAHPAARAMVQSLSLAHGFRLFFPTTDATMSDDLRRARPTLAFSTPRVFERFHADVHARLPSRRWDGLLLRVPFTARSVRRRMLRDLGLDQVRAAVTGSAPMPAAVVEWYRRMGLTLIEGYAISATADFTVATVVPDVTPAAA